jgi:hypothetical protein
MCLELYLAAIVVNKIIVTKAFGIDWPQPQRELLPNQKFMISLAKATLLKDYQFSLLNYLTHHN